MKIIVINGSPKGKKSNSLKLARSFVAGYAEETGRGGSAVDIEELHVASKHIAPCKGCFACWKATPGMCCIHDDMAGIIGTLLEADLVIWSFPLYFFNVPGTLKTMVDRLLPMFLPFMSEREDGYGSGSHELRHENNNRKHVLISTCGFWSAEGNYDAVTSAFDHLLGKDNFESILCGQGELFGVDALSSKTDEYLLAVANAGAEYAKGGISESTRLELNRPLYPKSEYEAMADASWNVDRETGEKELTGLMLAEEMAARYKKNVYDGKDRVLELRFTDLDASFQILLGKDGAEVFTDGSLKTTTYFNTSFQVWSEIARGTLDPFKALDDHRLTVDGDMTLVTRKNAFFGDPATSAGGGAEDSQSDQKLPPSMATMLTPWITFWVVISSNAFLGAIVSIAVSAIMPIIMRKRKITRWDWISIITVPVLSIAAAIIGDGDMVACIGYLIFGLMWLGSCFTREPVCASYVKYQYGGEQVLDIPLFMKPNRILAAAWGVLYILTAIWTYFAMRAGFGDIVVIANCIVPAAMGAFTEWFQKWYPAYLARGGSKRSRG